MTAALKTSLAHWPELAQAIFVPHTDAEYYRLVSLLDALVDEVGNDEIHPLASLMEVLGALIEKYEDQHVPELDSEGVMREEPPAGAGQ
jgi:HTH-type transcriptional regulator/antitoxin HigA